MSVREHSFHPVRLVLTGMVLALPVSLATAAIVMYLPESPVYVSQGRDLQAARNLHAYVQLHQARNAAVPTHMQIDVTAGGQ